MKPIAVPTTASPLLDAKDYAAPSVFRADNLLREARRQKGLPAEPVPDVCVLDPDGDIVRLLRQERRAEPMLGWACYHTELMVAVHGGVCFGLIGCAVARRSPCCWPSSCSRRAAACCSASPRRGRSCRSGRRRISC